MLMYIARTGDITCGWQQCQNTDIVCDAGSVCNIYCASQGCLQSSLFCADGYDCNIYLSEYQSAFKTRINGTNAAKLLIVTGDVDNGNSQLAQSFIYCPLSRPCIVECNNNYHTCRLTEIRAEQSSSLGVTCSMYNEACLDLNVWCPMNGNCSIKGDTDTATMREMNIYSVRGFQSVHIEGTSSGDSIGTMHCLRDYGSQCVIDPNNNECDPDSSSNKTCDDPPYAYPTYVHMFGHNFF